MRGSLNPRTKVEMDHHLVLCFRELGYVLKTALFHYSLKKYLRVELEPALSRNIDNLVLGTTDLTSSLN